MHMNKVCYILLLCLIMSVACRNAKSDCNLQYAFADNNVKGCLTDSLEQGAWTVYDTIGKVLAEGQYDRGIKTGDWHYFRKGEPSVIKWKKITDPVSGIVINVPDDFSVVAKGDS